MTSLAVYRARALLLYQGLQLLDQPLVSLAIVRRVAENDLAVAVEGDPIVRVRQVLGGEPEVDRVLTHELQGPPRRDGRGSRRERRSVELADEGEVAHREFPP